MIALIDWAKNIRAQAQANGVKPEDEIWAWEFSSAEFSSDAERDKAFKERCQEYQDAIRASETVKISKETFTDPNLADNAGKKSGKQYLVDGPFGNGKYVLSIMTQ